MHHIDPSEAPQQDLLPGGQKYRWYKELTRYHWFVLTVAALGWLFDTMDQQLFNLARVPAMRELLPHEPGQPPPKEMLDFYGPLATSALDWVGHRWIVFRRPGRSDWARKVMLWTILVYSLCTGLSAFSVGFWDFAFYRFLTGLGVGGEFAVGVSLVAEVMPARARPFALGFLQALSAVGNITAALINMSLGKLESSGTFQDWEVGDTPVKSWRLMFVIGTVPALLAILIRRKLKEPEKWQQEAHQGVAKKQLGSYAELFGDPRWRSRALVGMLLAFAGVVGLWGIGFFSFDLIASVLRKRFEAQGMSESQISGNIAWWVGITSVMQNLGGFFGIYAYSQLTHYTGRKPAFAVSFVAAMLSTAMVYWYLTDFSQIFWMIPIMGFCQLSLFGGYAIYFPELFPTRLRSTGTSFCYNVGRFVAAIGPFTLGYLTGNVFTVANGYQEGMRYAGVSMCAIFLVGLLVLPFAPETRGKPLPE